MSEWKLMLSDGEVVELKIILEKCKGEFIRDKRRGREPLFNELTLLRVLNIMKMKNWVFGEYTQSSSQETKK